MKIAKPSELTEKAKVREGTLASIQNPIVSAIQKAVLSSRGPSFTFLDISSWKPIHDSGMTFLSPSISASYSFAGDVLDKNEASFGKISGTYSLTTELVNGKAQTSFDISGILHAVGEKPLSFKAKL